MQVIIEDTPQQGFQGEIKLLSYTDDQIEYLIKQPDNTPIFNAEAWRKHTNLSAVAMLKAIIKLDKEALHIGQE